MLAIAKRLVRTLPYLALFHNQTILSVAVVCLSERRSPNVSMDHLQISANHTYSTLEDQLTLAFSDPQQTLLTQLSLV